MAGDWDADDPAAVLAPFAARMATLVPAWMQRMRQFYVRHQPARERNTVEGARQNIERHYDLSNDLFALFLDETMTYSCARASAPATRSPTRSAARSTRLLDATGVALGSQRARDRHRLGNPRRARRATRRDRHVVDAVDGAGLRGPRSGAARRGRPIASMCSCATTERSTAGTTPSSASR